MERSIFALLIRGAVAGAFVALSAMGCVVGTEDQDAGEDIAESASELGEVTASGGVEGEITGDPQKDPDPVPWRPDLWGNDDPDPDPNMVQQINSTPGGGHKNDKN